MNLRFEILRAVSKNPGAPAAEICDAIDYDRQKTTWSVRDCAKAGLLTMRRDDVTGQPGYTLTDSGKERLAAGPATKQGGNTKTAQPAGAQNACSNAPGQPADVCEVAPAAADDIPAPENNPCSVSFNTAARAEAATDEKYSLLGILADIRAAVGDREGRLMQDELIECVRTVARSADRASADLDKIRATLQPLVYTGDPEHAPGPVKSAEHAAQWIESLSDTNREQLAAIACASETLAQVVHSATDTSDMDLDDLAKHVATTPRRWTPFRSTHCSKPLAHSSRQALPSPCQVTPARSASAHSARSSTSKPPKPPTCSTMSGRWISTSTFRSEPNE